MAPQRRWSEAEDETIAQMWPDHSATQIGQVLGVSRNAVIGRYHRLIGTRFASQSERDHKTIKRKIRRHQDTEKRRRIQAADVAVLRADGLTFKRIGRIYGISESAAWRRLERGSWPNDSGASAR